MGWAAKDEPLPNGLVALGEVGLSGEIRRVGGTGRRLAEAARQGYKVALVPPDAGAAPAGMRLVEGPRPRAALPPPFLSAPPRTRPRPPPHHCAARAPSP